jgi:photosystem II stability/assembly factor-like uncharacterized protein
VRNAVSWLGIALAFAGCSTTSASSSDAADLDPRAAGTTASAAPAPPDQVGVWVNVTPAGLDVTRSTFDNFGAQDVLADPARPGDFYAFTCFHGVWRSRDFGRTWARISKGSLPAGKQWTAAIDKNPNRDPATPPTLWTTSWGPDSPLGVFKSTDGGVRWKHYALPAATGQDGYALDVDPYDAKHLIIGFHEANGLAESVDGGETWKSIPIPAAAGQSIYPFFIDTGAAASTRKTWITIAQPQGGAWGTWRTADQGATWTRVEKNEHAHGNAQLLTVPGGPVYMAGIYGTLGWGLYKSTDFGATWTSAQSGGKALTGVVATATRLYASYAWAIVDGAVDPTLLSALRTRDTAWTAMAAPAGMSNGWKRAAVSFDGRHDVIVTGNWNTGLWRYVEP